MSDHTDPSPGSQATSPAEQRKSQLDYQFLNFSHPSEAKASRARRTVRSHVTRQQHQREQAAAVARRSQSQQALETQKDLATAPQRSHAATDPPKPSASVVTPESSNQSSSSPGGSPSPASPTPSPLESPERRVNISEVYPHRWISEMPRVMVGWTVTLFTRWYQS
jgi:hypothetical protein